MKTPAYKYFLQLTVLFIAGSLIFSSCTKDEEEDDILYKQENEDFYEFMLQWYYWNEEIPNINPSEFPDMDHVLEEIKNQEYDRWSYITDLEAFMAYFEESKMIGYGFGSAWDSEDNLRISFVFNTTAMYEQGVRRSWIIEEINGTTVSPGTHINQMLGPNEPGVENTFRFRKPDGTTVDMQIHKEEVVMNSILYHDIIELEDINVGYLVLQGFTTPTEDELNQVFGEFAAEEIDELILDMRYNGGGQTSIAKHISSMIGGSAVIGQPFAKYRYNDLRAEENNKTENFGQVDHTLDIDRLVTICTNSTASASEMVINGLLPFMDVSIVGNDTYGKPMGMNAFNYNNTYALVPITFKIANANDEGDYFDGLPVDVPAGDDLSRMFGDLEETSLQQALLFIQTGSTKGAPVHVPAYKQPVEQMTGLQRIIGAF